MQAPSAQDASTGLPVAGEPAARWRRGEDGELAVELMGPWRSAAALRAGETILRALAAAPKPARVTVSAGALTGWDSAFVAVLMQVRDSCARAAIPLAWSEMPAGASRLVGLASAVPEARAGRHGGPAGSPLARLGRAALSRLDAWGGTVHFLGQVVLAFGRLARRQARFRPVDLWRTVLETGAQALPIVAVITLLVGLILAFIGAVQLSQFGASIYVADLVGLAMTREMAAVMTAIVLAGRTGANFAAQLGTMQGNEEIDALITLGIPPVEYLVLPRMLALALMMPLLYVYGCFIGLFGGYLVATGMLHLSSVAYIDRTRAAVHLADFMIGFVKSGVFGLLVAFAGCQRGIEAGRSAAAVGKAATSAVVSGIVYIIVTDALFSVLLNILKI